MLTTLTKELDFEIANAYRVLQEKKCNQFYWGYYNTVVNDYCILNDQVYLFFCQSTAIFLP